MADTKQQSLSALIDGEANEIEVHRLVREFKDGDSLTRSWAIYLHIRSVVRSFYIGGHQPHNKQPRADTFGPSEHRLLHDRISQAIQQETTYQAPLPRRTWSSRSGVIGGSLALAASLIVAVFIGFQKPAQEESDFQDARLQTNESGRGGSQNSTQVAGQAVDDQSVPFATQELIELDEEKQRRLRAYLHQHDRMARMSTMPQLVNYETTPPEK